MDSLNAQTSESASGVSIAQGNLKNTMNTPAAGQGVDFGVGGGAAGGLPGLPSGGGDSGGDDSGAPGAGGMLPDVTNLIMANME